jgi:Tfp pilus assembly protein PilO
MSIASADRGRWLLPLTLVVGTAAWLPLLFWPGKKAIADLRHDLKTRQDYVMSASRSGPLLESTARELERTRAYNAHWRGRLADSAQLASLFSEIAQLVRQSGAATTRFAPQSPIQYDHVRRIPLAVACEGTFEQLQALLLAVEQLGQRLWVSQVKLEAGEAGQLVKCELTLVIFADQSAVSD